jgi:ferritin-like metal-binding protein YciE
VENPAKSIFIVGLCNAHAMEIQARELMERQSQSLTDYPEVQTKVASHLTETKAQSRRLEQCLESSGESTSFLKDTAQSIIGNFLAMSHALAEDEILKDTLANNAFALPCERSGQAASHERMTD